MKRKYTLISGGILLILLTLTLGCTEETQTQEDQMPKLEEDLKNAQTTIIELQENEEYIRIKYEKAEKERGELQKTYDGLLNDFYNCYMANYCLYYPNSCEEYFEDDWTATENHIYYSDECDKSDRDWEEYMEKRSEEK